MDLRELLRIEHRVIQAGMGGIARAELASAVSRAGGLGMLGLMRDPEAFRREIRLCREQCAGRTFAVNLLMPFAKRAHLEVCIAERVPVVTLFFGHDAEWVRTLHEAKSVVLHQVGSFEQGQRALREGADGLVAQGLGAGGHVMAEEEHATLIAKLRSIAGARPVIASGGITDREDAAQALAAGAAGVWVGSRFLLTHESAAHDAYKARLLAADRTFETYLFGLGWPERHRVAPNAATERWCRDDARGPRWVRSLHRGFDALSRLAPSGSEERIVSAQTLRRPLFSPIPLVRGMDERFADVTPLYAGAAVPRIATLMPAADVVRSLGV